MTTPLVSIIIPIYNRSEFARDLVESLLSQTEPRWEAVMVDDGSVPEELEAWRALINGDERFVLLQREREPKGAPTCRNIGVEASRGAFVMFLDSDDLLVGRECLAERLRGIERFPGVDFWVFATEVFRAVPGDRGIIWNVAQGEDDLNRFLRRDNPWCISGPVWKRETLKRVGPWDENLPGRQDWEYHVRALCKGFNYRRASGGLTYWRETQQGSISSTLANANNLKASYELFSTVSTLLRTYLIMTTKRNRLFGKLYLVTAIQWGRLGRFGMLALTLWNARQQRHITSLEFQLLLLHGICSASLSQKRSEAVFRLVLHEDYFSNRRSTLLCRSVLELADWEKSESVSD